MGRSDPHIFYFYKQNIKPKGDVALLGFSSNQLFAGDLYDLSLGNWEINSDWQLAKKYDTIISTRCPYFSKDPEDFIKRCHTSLNKNGRIYADWGLGDHWRFPNYKIGWVKDGEHEHAYENDNFLWSALWDPSFSLSEEFKKFSDSVAKLGYPNTAKAIQDEVPKLLSLDFVKKYFDCEIKFLFLWPDSPQLYTLIEGIKK